MLSTPNLTPIQSLPTEVEKVLKSQPTLPVERPWEDVEGKTSDSPKFCASTIENDPPVTEISCFEIESEDSSSNTTDSDSDDPFNLIDKKLSVWQGNHVFGDASHISIREAIDALKLLMIRHLSEVCSDPSMRSQLDYFLNILIRSRHCVVTEEVKEALVEFQRNAFSSFQEFQATIDPVNKLKKFREQKARIEEESSSGKNRRKDLRSCIKKASLAIKEENNRKKELESEIANIRKHIYAKEMDLQQLVLNVKNQEREFSTYEKTRDSLEELARALSKQADDLLSENKGIEDEGKAAELKQNTLKSTWSTDLPSQLNKIKSIILGL
ncbi:hypothetical protein VNO78_07214 [Psophocarpus tetragonolobus]|uniref:Uncharacterized protein n=1 Tax=Psophocarpus tetragonolobus TaxID=3891 RepID=A0AAN9SVX2_PSOTE